MSSSRIARGGPRRRADGFALPWVLLTLVAVSLLVSTGFLQAWLGRRTGRSFDYGTRAFYLAEAGLATALAGATGPTPSLGPIVFPEGVVTTRFDKLVDLGVAEAVFRIESEGAVPSLGDSVRRAVGQLAWVAGPPRAPAALTVFGTVLAGGASGSVSGLDAGTACGVAGDVAGLYQSIGPPIAPGGPLAILGAPPVEIATPAASVVTVTGIRWRELLAAFGPRPDAIVPPDPWPVGGLGSAFILARGPVTLGPDRSGSGALVVDGDLTLASGFVWRGAIVVGGSLHVSGLVRIRGAALVGVAGHAAAIAELSTAVLDITFDSCMYNEAVKRLMPH
ncbi:MAG: hypothetical protein MJB57_07255, partial [Gemmatimonadetes bacterium]|nr:hypothetical protein [Gemmatimonadota bacterium]